MIIPIELDVSIFNEYVEDINLARVDLTEGLIAWIRKMERLVKRHDIAYIADYECSPIYLYKDEGEDPPEIKPYDGSTECDMIVVRKGSFYWKGIIKHTDVHIETDSMSLEDLDKLIKFYNEEPSEMLPKYINDEDYSTREIALRRMKGE
jgi:hypothetical protein